MLRASQDRKYAFILLAVAAGILAAGILLRPARTEVKKPAVEVERLQQISEQRRLQDLSSYLTNAASGVASSLVYLNRTGTSGLVWGSRDQVLAPRKGPAPFMLVAAKDPAAVIPAYRLEVPPQSGEWVLAIAKNRDQQIVFAHGLYQGRVRSRCGSFTYDEIQSSAPLSSALVGGGLFTLQGQLLGFIGTCGSEHTVIAASTIAEVLARPVTLNERLESDYGFKLSPAAGQLKVVEIWRGSPADSAGLQPGDLFTSVDGTELTSPDQLEVLEREPPESHSLGVQRERRKTILQLRPAQLPEPVSTWAGMTLGLGLADRDLTVLAVTAGSPSEHAGVLPGDLIRKVGKTPVNAPAEAARALEDRKEQVVVLDLQRDGKELEVLLEP